MPQNRLVSPYWAPHCTGIYRCTWSGEECDASDFEATLTDLGVCYTFNSRTPAATVNESGESHIPNTVTCKIKNINKPDLKKEAALKFL